MVSKMTYTMCRLERYVLLLRTSCLLAVMQETRSWEGWGDSGWHRRPYYPYTPER